jgi:DNA-binding transcriptional LysR family regulator
VVVHACAAEGFTPTVAFESEGTMTVRALAAAGLGIAVVPRSVTIGDGPRVAVLELNPPHLTRTVMLAWSKRGHRTPAAEAFLAFARESVELAEH